jgi:hypothetical protein
VGRYEELIEQLAHPITFPPEVFIGDDRVPQDVCDFILTLALVYNDFKDLVFASQLMQVVNPGEGPPSAARGQHGGLHVHLMRLLAGVLNELAKVIEKRKNVIKGPVFTALLKKVPESARTMWNHVVAASLATGPSGDRFGRLVYFARHKVTFHYDTKEIARGYRLRFLDDEQGPPYVSRGRNMAATRFYFADAAANAYMMRIADANTGKEFFEAGWKLLPEVGHALREIVSAFVKARAKHK